jgi:hypothetical protein
VPKSLEEHAENWDLHHEDFTDNDFLYDAHSVMRRNAPFAHTDTSFLGVTHRGAWMAVRYEECYRIAQDWQHFSRNRRRKTPSSSPATSWSHSTRHSSRSFASGSPRDATNLQPA